MKIYRLPILLLAAGLCLFPWKAIAAEETDNYRIGIGDLLQIEVYGEVQNRTVRARFAYNIPDSDRCRVEDHSVYSPVIREVAV